MEAFEIMKPRFAFGYLSGHKDQTTAGIIMIGDRLDCRVADLGQLRGQAAVVVRSIGRVVSLFFQILSLDWQPLLCFVLLPIRTAERTGRGF